ncbi:MAG TPA: diguanylate cyclase [Anaerolineales bacterium]|nr:diguanylate cyclase [Anaerolineales bacterium]
MHNLFTRFTEFLDRQSVQKRWIFTIGPLLLLGYLDYLTGHDLVFSPFYILPVFTAAWTLGKRSASMVAILSGMLWFSITLLTGHPYVHEFTFYWEVITRIAIYLFVAVTLSELREALEREKLLSRSDPLTGLLNRNAFYDLTGQELLRAQRYGRPVTLVYLDIDNFKTVNDCYGHRRGDMLLIRVAHILKTHLRKTDTVTRLGGDEYALLLPETDNSQARFLVSRIREALLSAMHNEPLPITFSIGVVTCPCTHRSVDTLIQHADQLMYSVKQQGKNGIAYAEDENDLLDLADNETE